MDKALLIGINKYPTMPLSMCLRDVEHTLAGILKYFDFDPKGIRILCDERATTQNILTRLSWLVDGVKPGDRLLFLYSGHGAQVATRDVSGEVDGLDEVICPVDFDWTDDHMVRDKQFNEIFRRVPNGVEFIWISDSCHSGDLQKSIKPVGKCLRPPIDIAWRNQQARSAGITGGVSTDNLNVALISGCKSNEVSMESTDGGAMTSALWRVLEKNPTWSLEEVMERVVRLVQGQTPQLLGSPDICKRPFLWSGSSKRKG